VVHSELDALDVAILREVKRSTKLTLGGPAPDAGTVPLSLHAHIPRRWPAPQAEIER
jgi:hypothetical protein